MTRRNFTAKIKAAAFERCKDGYGVPRCEECGAALKTGNISYDHVLADGLTGEPTLENCAVVCTKPCHSFKTRKHDIPAIARAKRLHDKHFGIKPKKRPWGGNLRRKMSGEVVER